MLDSRYHGPDGSPSDTRGIIVADKKKAQKYAREIKTSEARYVGYR